MNIEDVHNRLCAEFLEMPGLRLTSAQVQRLCGVDRVMCDIALSALVNAKFLCVKSDGSFARSTDGIFPRPRPASASLADQRTLVKAS